MFRKFVRNRITCTSDGNYKCYMCNKHLDDHYDSIFEHIDDYRHQDHYYQIDGYERGMEYDAFSSYSESDFKYLVKNYVVCKSYCLFYCHLCYCEISGLSNTLDHVHGFMHKEFYKTKHGTHYYDEYSEDEDDDDDEYYNDYEDDDSFNDYDDYLEDDSFYKYYNNEEYDYKPKATVVKKKKQAPAKQFQNDPRFNCFIFNEEANTYECRICYCDISCQQNFESHVNGFYHRQLTLPISHDSLNKVIEKIRYCKICKVFLASSLMLQCHIMVHLFEEVYNENNDIIQLQFKKTRTVAHCLLCNIAMADDSLPQHLLTNKHSNFIKLLNTLKVESLQRQMQLHKPSLENLQFEPNADIHMASLCTVCEIPINGIFVHDHLCGNKHTDNVNNNINKLKDRKVEVDDRYLYICFICNTLYASIKQLLSHYNENNHVQKIEFFNMVQKSSILSFYHSNDKIFITCSLCVMNMDNCDTAIQHLKIVHEKNDTKVENKTKPVNDKVLQSVEKEGKMDTINNNNIKSKEAISVVNKVETNSKTIATNVSCNSSNLNVSQTSTSALALAKSNVNDINNILNDLVKLELKCREDQLPPAARKRKYRKPDTEFTKDIFYEENLKKYGKSFIKLCIESGKENIYDREAESIRILKLETDLIVSLENNKFCLPCKISLSNNKQLLFEHFKCKRHFENLQEMETNDKSFQYYSGQFSDLKLAQNYMHVSSNNKIKCCICNIEIINNNSTIYEHITHPQHIAIHQLCKQQAEDIYEELLVIYDDVWYYAQVFTCAICNVKCDNEIEFVKHLENSQHIKICTQLLSKKINLKFGVCPACITYWYGQSDFYDLHLQESLHKRFIKNGDFEVPKMTDYTIQWLNNVNEKIDTLIEESNKENLESPKIKNLLADIEKTTKCVHPNSKAHVFGSRLSNLAFSDSDVDVYLNCNTENFHGSFLEYCQQYLMSLIESFETKSDIWTINEFILDSRVPTIKLLHLPTSLNSDISFGSSLNIEKSMLIRRYCEAYPICRKLIIYLKKWIILSGLSGTGCLSTYAISWYVIFYLQMANTLPSVSQIINEKNETKIIDGWECGFPEKITASQSGFTFQDHLQGFFSFYTNFDYKTEVACPYLGKIIKKRHFIYINKLPKEMNLYISYMNESKSKTFRIDSPMCIQDPIDLSYNITNDVNKQVLRRFRQYSSECSTILLHSYIKQNLL